MPAKLDRRNIIFVYDEIGLTILIGGDLLGVQDGTEMSVDRFNALLADRARTNSKVRFSGYKPNKGSID